MFAKSSYTRSWAAWRGLRERLALWLGRPVKTGIGVRAEAYDSADGDVGRAAMLGRARCAPVLFHAAVLPVTN